MKAQVQDGTNNDEAYMDAYLSHHYLEKQPLIDGVVVNPYQREMFDATSNDDRNPQEIEDWWGIPYITVTTYFVNPNYTAAKNDKEASEWAKNYQTGNRYDVRCLDGGAWDRSTGIKYGFNSLLEAIDFVKANYDLNELYDIETTKNEQYGRNFKFAKRKG
jgi:hypothetical protein